MTLGIAIAAILAVVGIGASILVFTRIVARTTQAITEIADRARSLQTHCISGLRDGMTALARGDLRVEVTARTAPIAITGNDELSALARDVSTMIADVQSTLEAYDSARTTLDGAIAENSRVIDACRRGDLTVRGEAARFDGAYRTLIGGMNEAVTTVAGPLDATAAALDRLAERDLTARVDGRFDGAFRRMQDSFNNAA
nr:hypothetical protein [Gemmatimonadaceae bacterium]